MRKNIILMLVGLFGICVFSPTVVKANEIQKISETSDLVSPLSADETLITLKNGESFERSLKGVFIKQFSEEGYPMHRELLMNIESLDPLPELFEVNVSVPTSNTIRPYREFFLGSASVPYTNIANFRYSPNSPEIHDVLFKLTNYSAGPVTYRVKLQFIWVTIIPN